jgi:MFS family permease
MLIALVIYQIAVTGPSLAMLAVFMTPLIHSFGWSHEQVSEVVFASIITGGLVGFAVGWLIDKVGARWVMGSGLLVVAATLWMASHATSLHAMVRVFAIYGVGAMLSGVLPVSVLNVNWFGKRRGLAGGLLWFALAVGMMSAPPILTWLIAHYGWRASMRWVTAPIVLVGLPIALFVVRTRPPIAQATNIAQEVAALPGLELGSALCAAGFWLVLLGDVLYSTAFGSVNVHSITYLIGLGYTPQHSALVFSGQVMMSAFGSVLFGAMADRTGARRSIALAMVIVPLGLLAFTRAGNPHLGPAALVMFMLCWGIGAGCITPLLPILLADTLGLRRLGSVSGVVRSAAAIASAFGPLIAGGLFDMTGSYFLAFYLAAGAMVIAALAISAVRPAPGRDLIPGAAPLAAGLAAGADR